MKKKLEDDTYEVSPRGEIDYIQRHQAFADEKRRDYNNWLQQQKREQQYRWRREVTPPGGLAVGAYEQHRKVLRQTRNREYRDMLEKKQQEDIDNKNRHPTPQGGLSIPTQGDRRLIEEAKKRVYRDDLIKQKKNQLLIRAQQNGEIPMIDGRYLQNNPNAYSYHSPREEFRGGQAPPVYDPRQFAPFPPGPDNSMMYRPPEAEREFRDPPVLNDSQGRDLDYDQFAAPPVPKAEPREEQVAPPLRVDQAPVRAPLEEDNYRAFVTSEDRTMEQKKRIGDERKHEYERFLARKQREEQKKREKFQHIDSPPATTKKNDWYSSEEYEKKKSQLNVERKKEYNEFISQQRSKPKERQIKTPIAEDNQLLFLGQYERTRQQLAEKRRQECIDYTEQTPRPPNRKPLPVDGRGMLLPLGTYERTRKNLEEERKKDFKVFIEQQSPREKGQEMFQDGSDLSVGTFGNVHKRLQARQRASEPPRRPAQDTGDDQGFVGNLGAYERERQNINVERQRDYNRYLDQKYTTNSKPHGRPDFVKRKELQDSLDPRLDAHHYYRNTGGPPGPSQFPHQAAITSPVSQTYAELLEQKRRQEAQYRQTDPVYHRPDEMPTMRQSPASFPRTQALY